MRKSYLLRDHIAIKKGNAIFTLLTSSHHIPATSTMYTIRLHAQCEPLCS